MNVPRLLAVALAAAISLSSAQAAPAPEGALDRSFGHEGMYLAQTPEEYFSPAGIALQRDGKILVLGGIGSLHDDSWPNCRLTRLLPNGTPDTSFGDHGSQRVGDPNGYTSCTGLAVGADGKIVISGYIAKNFVALRYLADGSRDTSFGDAGMARTTFTDLGFRASAFDMVLQDDGKPILVGRAYDDSVWPVRYRFAMVRYGTDGRLDSGFGDGGRVLTSFADFSRFDAEAEAVTLLPDGRILVVGGLHGVYATAIARYTPDGRPDSSFGNNGRIASFGDNLNRGGASLTLQPDGRFLMARPLLGNEGYSTVVRHFADGRLDPSFQHITYIGLVSSVQLQADGRILVSGLSTYNDPGRPQGEVIRLNPDGTRDESFVMEPFDFGGGMDYFTGLALQPGGKIVVLAQAHLSDRLSELGVARLQATTYCIADGFDPRRYVGFSDSGWFSASGHDHRGAGFGVIGRGQTTTIARAGLHLFKASEAASGAKIDAAVFATRPDRGWGLGRVSANAGAGVDFALLDPRLDDLACRTSHQH
ncbi:MAG: hypothetical protein ACREP7_11360 [Lysobacter sp.]